MGRHRQLASQFARAQNLDPFSRPAGQAEVAQSIFVDCGPVLKFVQRIQIDWNVADGECLVVKSALGNATDQGHLATFESDAN